MTRVLTHAKVAAGTVIAVGAVVSGSLASAQGAVASRPAKAVTITGQGAASARASLELLAGSASDAVYSVKRTLVSPDTARSRPVLTVRYRSGKVVRLGSMSDRVQQDSFSTLGHWVVVWSSSQYSVHTRVVDVWNLTTRHHRVVKLKKAAQIVQATPNGFVYTFGNSLIDWVAKTGSSRSWGSPFADQKVASIAADDRGFVVTGRTHGAKLMSFSHAGTYRRLPSGRDSQYCSALNRFGASCEVHPAGGGPVDALAFLPRGGGKETRVSTGTLMVDDVALAGKEVMFTAEQTDDVPYLYGFHPTNPALVKWPTLANYDMISAFGKALIMRNRDPHVVEAATTPRHLTKAFAIPRSTDSAGDFALSSGRIAYISNLRDASDPAQTLSVQSISVANRGGQLRIGVPKQVSGQAGKLQIANNFGSRYGLAATATTTAFMRSTDCCTLHAYVHSPAGTVELPGVFDPNYDTLVAAGHRVLAANESNPPGPVDLYDTRTGVVTDLTSVQAENPVSFALTSSYLVYGTTSGLVRRMNLSTGVTTTVYSASLPAGHTANPIVYATNDWVAWDISKGTGSKAVRTEGMRKVTSSLDPVITLPDEAYGISAAGVLLFKENDSYEVRTWLRPFSGATRRLLSTRQYAQFPQLVGHVLAWVDGGGDLKAEHTAA